MKTLGRLWEIIFHPLRTAEELAREPSLRSASAVVLGLGICTGLMFAVSAARGDYPPPPDVLKTWIDSYGEFAMLPFLKIPAESYRLFEAFIAVPMLLAGWMLMGSTARLLTRLLGGRLSYEQYLNLFAFSFFTFWILAQLMEMSIETVLGAYMLPALRNAYGPLAQGFFTYVMSIGWPLWLLIGGVYSGLAAWACERFAAWKAVLIGGVSMTWPILMASFILR